MARLIGRSLAGVAALCLTGAGVSFAPPAAAAAPPPTTGQGLRADYYLMPGIKELGFTTYVSTRVEKSLNVPDLLPQLSAAAGTTNAVAARMTGQVDIPTDGAYTFWIKADNGYRLSIDGKTVIDHWATDWDVETGSQPVTLSAGAHEIALDYNQGEGGANIKTDWAGPGFARTALPDSALHQPAGFTLGTDVKATVGKDGRTATVTLPPTVTSAGNLTGHVALMSPGQVCTDVRADMAAKTLTLTCPKPISLGREVQFNYDGRGDIRTASGTLGAQSVTATNASEYFFATPWAKQVDKANPLPEYPRPQLQRTQWRSLNGQWQFQGLTGDVPVPAGKLSSAITVPFAPEAALSGVGRHHDWSVYRRTFQVPANWTAGGMHRVRLNFGAVDDEAWVHVNGKQVAHHLGGYTAFSADITDALLKGRANTLTVKVKDTTDGFAQPVGKQSATPGGIWYTPASGIWQTVWLEPVARTSIDKIDMTPQVSATGAGSVDVTVRTSGTAPSGARASVTILDKGRTVATASVKPNVTTTIQVPNAHLWTPDDPHLYDVKATLLGGGLPDSVTSYIGIRTLKLADVGGVKKVVLNNKPTFLLSTLDQGYWPDGIYTAPTDEALKFDLVKHKELGFNTVRKHIKVEPARWYAWADKLGLLVWQDMPSLAPGAPDTAANKKRVFDQDAEIVDQLRSVPSLVMWTGYNEGWGEMSQTLTTERSANLKKLDPARLLDAHSGVNCCISKGDTGTGDLIDWHDYHGPAFPQPDAKRAAADGEHGGYSYKVDGHIWSDQPGQDYGDAAKSKAELTAAYVANTRPLIGAAASTLSGSVYTQITDVENELNGLYTYDRAVEKIDPAAVRKVNQQVIAAGATAGSPPSAGTPGFTGVGWWPLRQNLTDAVSGMTGTINGTPSFVTSPTGGALQLNGQQAVDTGVQPLNPSKDGYSVAARVRLDDLNGFQTIASLDGARHSVFFLQYSGADKRLAFSFAGARALADTIGEPTPGKWYHLVGSYDPVAKKLRIYVDGKLAGEQVATNSQIAVGNVILGRGLYDTRPVDYLHGALSDVHVYDRTVTDAEAASLAAAEPTR